MGSAPYGDLVRRVFGLCERERARNSGMFPCPLRIFHLRYSPVFCDLLHLCPLSSRVSLAWYNSERYPRRSVWRNHHVHNTCAASGTILCRLSILLQSFKSRRLYTVSFIYAHRKCHRRRRPSTARRLDQSGRLGSTTFTHSKMVGDIGHIRSQ